MIKCINITKKFEDLIAVDSISFEVKKGEIVGLLGPNGAGKTTTMRMITGYYEPTSGSIEIDGINVVENPLQAKAKLGYLPENAPLYEDMTASEYLNFIADIRGIKDKRKRMDDIIQIAGIEKVYNRFIWELSKGYHQRVGIAQTLMSDPDFLVLDEPTSGLDPNQIIEIRNLIKELGKEKTIILSTHILQEAEAIASKIIIIDKAKIVASGNRDELRAFLKSNETIVVTAKTPVKFKEELKKMSDILEIKILSTENDLERMKIYAKKDLAEEVFNAAVRTNTVLRELTSEKATLEDIFTKVTQREERQ